MTGIPRKQIEADRSTLWCRQDKALRIQVAGQNAASLYRGAGDY